MHRKRNWKPFRRTRCVCGLPWPCLELRLRAARERAVDTNLREFHRWAGPTQALNQVGRAGRLTPAQAFRANGGRW